MKFTLIGKCSWGGINLYLKRITIQRLCEIRICHHCVFHAMISNDKFHVILDYPLLHVVQLQLIRS